METKTIVQKIIDRILASKNTGSNTHVISIDSVLKIELSSQNMKCLVNNVTVLECSPNDFGYSLIIETLKNKRADEKSEALKVL